METNNPSELRALPPLCVSTNDFSYFRRGLSVCEEDRRWLRPYNGDTRRPSCLDGHRANSSCRLSCKRSGSAETYYLQISYIQVKIYF